ncbi:MAG: OmpA family protein [Deltaproteobacteria bacterium]|nr:OmpA family protein [Deltaproteobacteria bacterium]
MRIRHVSWGLPVLAWAALGCGHSEAEWQAQLDKYNQQVMQTQQRDKKIAGLQQELDAAKQRVSALEQELQAMGMGLESKGKTIEALNANLAEMKKALEDYKARARTLELIKARMIELRRKLDALVKLGLKVNIRKNRMVISLPGDILFDTGKTDLKEEGKQVLLKVAEVVRNDATLRERDFQVAGHTDNAPLTHGPYVDNWGLSLMRARQVLVFLIAPDKVAKPKPGFPKTEPGGGLAVSHWSAAGYGETDPIVPNDAPANMGKNRRVELVVVPNVEEMLDLKSLTQM